MGDAAPAWDATLGDHVKNDFAASNEPWIAVRRARPGPDVFAEFVDVTRTRLAQEAGAVRGAVGGRRLEPGRAIARTPSSWRCACSTVGCTSRTSGGLSTGPVAAGTWRRRWPSTGCRTPCPSWSASRPGAPTEPPSASRSQARRTTRAPSPSPSRAAGPSRVGDEVAPTVTLSLSSIDFLRLGCGRVTAAARWTVLEGGESAECSGLTPVSAAPCSAAMNFMF